jgi:hypothetical protein
MQPERIHRTHWIAIVAFFGTFGFLVQTVGHDIVPAASPERLEESSKLESSATLPVIEEQIAAPPVADMPLHVPAPYPLRALYSTGWTAGTATRFTRLLSLYDDSILNAVVLDIKDATGRLSYEPLDEGLKATGVGTKRIKDLKSVIDEFHTRGIYVIGRLTVFEDPFFSALHPEETYKDTRTGLPWTNDKGHTWLRADSIKTRDHVTAIARDAYAQGFDEINLDYVRFPSDGPLAYLDMTGFTKSKAETMEDFFVAMRQELVGIPLSADVFGLTMSASDDVGIGQKAVLIAPEVDALSPMVYPSHFWNGTYGIPVPASEPYKVVYKALSDGIKKLEAAGMDKSKIRPWLQDFDLVGVAYDAEKVRAQIQAAHDLGIESWMMWDPANNYTAEVYKEPEVGLEPTTTRLSPSGGQAPRE